MTYRSFCRGGARNYKVLTSIPGIERALWEGLLAHTFGASNGVVPGKQN